MPWRTAGVIVMTAHGLLVHAPTNLYVEADPVYPCTRLPSVITFHPHDPLYHSREYPCGVEGDGLGGVRFIMSPVDNIEPHGVDCTSPFNGTGCVQCLCSEYQQRWIIAPNDWLLIPSGQLEVRVDFMVEACTIPPPCDYPCSMLDPETGIEIFNPSYCEFHVSSRASNPADYNCDGNMGTDRDIEDFFACFSGNCCEHCTPDFDADGSPSTDQDIFAFFRALGGG